jgi:hypothetical protein
MEGAFKPIKSSVLDMGHGCRTGHLAMGFLAQKFRYCDTRYGWVPRNFIGRNNANAADYLSTYLILSQAIKEAAGNVRQHTACHQPLSMARRIA